MYDHSVTGCMRYVFYVWKGTDDKGEVGVIQRRRAAVSVSTLRNDVNRSV